MTDDSAPLTPCVNICVMHPREGLCTGCLRSMDEIIAWGGMTDGQRRAVMADLPARRLHLRQRRAGSVPATG